MRPTFRILAGNANKFPHRSLESVTIRRGGDRLLAITTPGAILESMRKFLSVLALMAGICLIGFVA